jgi:hypothetical protein
MIECVLFLECHAVERRHFAAVPRVDELISSDHRIWAVKTVLYGSEAEPYIFCAAVPNELTKHLTDILSRWTARKSEGESSGSHERN